MGTIYHINHSRQFHFQRKVAIKKFTKGKRWQILIIVKEKFAPNWSENFLFSKSFDFRVILKTYQLEIPKISPRSSTLQQQLSWQSVRLWIQRPGFDPRWGNFFPFTLFAFLTFFCFTKSYFCRLFSLVNFVLATFFQALCLVTKKFFFKITNALLP